jgi:guanine deaminase
MDRQYYRGSVLHFIAEPDADGNGVAFYEDGLLITVDGLVEVAGDYLALKHAILNDSLVHDYSGHLIVPGFIDTHIHFPQLDVVASYGEQLLDWLNNYTFPAEMRFADEEYANFVAEKFLDELLRSGTTTAMAYATVHPQSVQAFFRASEKRNTRMICGKVLMDRNAPEALNDTAESAYSDSCQLIEQWHGKGRQLYAVTPRFAPTSTPQQLLRAGELLKRYEGVYLQTHLSENVDEISWMKSLFPERSSYVDVYDHFGLLGERSVFGHGIHLEDEELVRLHEAGSSIAFCPTSNLFLGSGLLDVRRLKQQNIDVSIASDIGAGTSFCALQTLNEAYKIMQMQGQSLHPYQAFYWLTLGNAKSLRLDNLLGNFEAGKEADFLVLDMCATPLMKYRSEQVTSLVEKLFLLMMLGDDRVVAKTYVGSRLLHSRN